MIFASRDLQDFAKLQGSPRPLLQKGKVGERFVHDGSTPGLDLENLVGGAQEMLSIDFSTKAGVAEQSGDDSANRGKEHADEEKTRGDNDDDCSGRKLRGEGTKGGPEPTARSADQCGDEQHRQQSLGPETRGRRRGDEKGDHEDQTDGLEANHRHCGHEAKEKNIEKKGRPALGGGKSVVKTKQEKLL